MLEFCHALAMATVAACLLAAPAGAQVDFGPQSISSVGIFDTGRAALCEMDGINGPDLVYNTDGAAGWHYGILLNTGAGLFPLGGNFVSEGTEGGDIACCDIDGDGLMDILTTEPLTGNDRLRYLRQVSAGDWDSVETRTLAGDGDAITCCDLDGDGLADFMIANRAVGVVDVFLNDGSGTLASLSGALYAMGDVVDVFCCDVDADSDQDMITISKFDGQLRIRLNNGAGVFGSVTSYAVGTDPADVGCSDLNGDGFPDLAVPSEADDAVIVLLNDGLGGFAPTLALPSLTAPRRIACGDLDCDGDVDLAIGTQNTVRVLLNGGSGAAWTVDTWSAGVFTMRDLFAAELDGAAGTDLLAFHTSGGATVSQFLNIGAGCADCVDPAPDAVAWYPGDLCMPDDLITNHPGTFIGLPFCPFPWIGGGALGFDTGPPVYVTVPNDCELAPGDGAFSVNAWVRTNATGAQPFVSMGAGPGYEFGLFDGKLRLVVCDAFNCWLTEGSTLIDDGGWHHVAFTIAPGPMTAMRVWVDGLLEDLTLASVGTVDPSHPMLIGAGPSPLPTFWLDGAIDELQVHDRALSAAEIHAIHLAGIAGQCKTNLCPPSFEGESPDMVELTAGVPDGFTIPSEPAVPGAVLAASCAGPVDFDVTPAGGSLCHTFTGLTDNIVGATLEIRIRASGSGAACDDTLSLQATGGVPAFQWSRRLGAPDGCAGDEGLRDCAWSPSLTHTFCLDLAELPEVGGSTSSVLDTLNTTDRLDVRVEGDSAVDYVHLRLAVCPCAADATCDGMVDVGDLLDVLADWGPCPPPCPPCAADVTGDCVVDVADLLIVLGAWGPC